MISPALSTIAQLLFADETTLDFARIVAELDAVLSRLRDGDVAIQWDCDDLVTFDIPDTRIVLAWTDVGVHRLGGCLTVSVGPCPTAGPDPERTQHDVLCSRLVERIQGRFNPAAVLWCQVAGAVDADVVDDMMDALPEMANGLPPVESILEGLSRADLHRSQQGASGAGNLHRVRAVAMPPALPAPQVKAEPAPKAMADPTPQAKAGTAAFGKATSGKAASGLAANDQPDLPLPRSAELARLRMALYPPQDQMDLPPPSTQMRLAAHCMNATLILVWAPLGAAVMTYSVLKGEDMALSARLMAVTGTLFALAHSPVGQTVAAMANSIG